MYSKPDVSERCKKSKGPETQTLKERYQTAIEDQNQITRYERYQPCMWYVAGTFLYDYKKKHKMFNKKMRDVHCTLCTVVITYSKHSIIL